jgi:hypothetical protein
LPFRTEIKGRTAFPGLSDARRLSSGGPARITGKKLATRSIGRFVPQTVAAVVICLSHALMVA